MDLDVSFKEFRRAAVWASDIANYWYCACKILLKQSYGGEETAEMNEGKARHQAESETDIQAIYDTGLRSRPVEIKTLKDVFTNNIRNLEVILSRGLFLPDNREHRAYYGMINSDPPIVGIPDAIGLADRGWVVVYEKKRRLAPDGGPYYGQRMQIATYLMTLEQIGITKCFGVVYSDLRPEVAPMPSRVYLSDDDRANVIHSAEVVKKIRSLELEPMPTSNPNKCPRCQYGPYAMNVCRFTPARQFLSPS